MHGGMLDGMTDGPTKNYVPLFIGAITVVAVTMIVCLTILSLQKADATEISRLLNTTLNFVAPIIGGGGLLVGIQARNQAAQAAEAARVTALQTNGALDLRIQSAVARALTASGQPPLTPASPSPPPPSPGQHLRTPGQADPLAGPGADAPLR